MKRVEILAYAAGIVDGEGSIQITRTKRKDSRNGVALEFRVLVGNTKEWLCQWFKMQFGGSVSFWKPQKANWNPCYVWQVRGDKAVDFLNLILPYLQLKAEQANLGIQFQKEKKNKTEKSFVIREAQRILMRSMNKKTKV